MQLALMAYSFVNQLAAGTMDQADVIEFASLVGVGAVELMDDYALEDRQLAVTVSALRRTGTTVACYDIVGDFAQIDPARREASLVSVRVALTRAASLGARHVLLIPAAPDPRLPVEAVRQLVADGLRACLPEVRAAGLTASLPNLGELAAFYGELGVVANLLDAAGPELGLTYDVGNWLLANEDPLLALEHLAARVAHVHLKDWRIEPDGAEPGREGFLGLDGRRYIGVALGEGSVDLAGTLARLGRLGYAGYLAIEYEGADDPAPQLRRGIAHARQLLGGALPR